MSGTPSSHLSESYFKELPVREDQPLQGERIIFRIHPTFYSVGVSYLLAALCSLLVAGIIGYFRGSLWAVLIFTIVFFSIPFYRHIQRNSTVYVLTSTKIEVQSGLLSKTIRNVPLSNIQDITTSATFPRRFIGVGDVIIDSAAHGGKIPMKNISDPHQHAELILEQLHRWNLPLGVNAQQG